MLLAAPPGLVTSQWDRDDGDDDEPAVVKLLPSDEPPAVRPPAAQAGAPFEKQTCFNCGETGHRARDCKQPDKRKQAPSPVAPVPSAVVEQLQVANERLAMENHILTVNAQLVMENEMLRLQWEAMGRQSSQFYGGYAGAHMPALAPDATWPTMESPTRLARKKKKERAAELQPATNPVRAKGAGKTPVTGSAATSAFASGAFATGALALARAQAASSAAALTPAKAPAAPAASESSQSASMIDKDGEPMTTVMLRNVPNDYTRALLLEVLDKEFRNQYNFCYLPVDFKSGASLGYAFVNLVSNKQATKFKNDLQGFADWAVVSTKVCSVSWSSPFQGLDAHLERFRNSPVMHETVPDEHKPMLLENGVRIIFPPPTKPIRAPRVRPGRVQAPEADVFEHQ